MEKYEFELSDEGFYVFEMEGTDDRWCITHPTEGYIPNESTLFDMYIESLKLNNKEIKHLGALMSLQECEFFLTEIINQGYTYETIDNKLLSVYIKYVVDFFKWQNNILKNLENGYQRN